MIVSSFAFQSLLLKVVVLTKMSGNFNMFLKFSTRVALPSMPSIDLNMNQMKPVKHKTK